VLVGDGRVALRPWYRRATACLWAMAGSRFDKCSVANHALELLGKQQGMFIDRHEVGQPNEFANWTDEELEAFIKSDAKLRPIVPGKTQH
jgi:hypothetical protein